MNIDLPQSFSCQFQKGYAIVQENTLKIKGDVKFRNLMYELTYDLRGKNCVYCGRSLKDGEETLDHGYPESMGGPTITNNLFPCCKNCNTHKNDYTQEEYEIFKQLRTDNERRKYHRQIILEQEKIRKSIGYNLPEDWVEEGKNDEVFVKFNLSENFNSREYKRLKSHYRKYGNFSKPVIVDNKNILLSGFRVLMACKNLEVNRIPIIKLENVQLTI